MDALAETASRFERKTEVRLMPTVRSGPALEPRTFARAVDRDALVGYAFRHSSSMKDEYVPSQVLHELAGIGAFLKKSFLRLAPLRHFPYISFLRKGTAERSDAVIGMSSNGRTADSGSVNGGSTPSIPAIAFATYGPFV